MNKPARRVIWDDDNGSAMVEFALVLPIFLTLLIGGFFAAFLLFSVSGLHYAAERAARCAKVQTSVCSDATTTQNYALTQYSGYGSNPTFTYTSAACGKQVSAALTFSFNFYVRTVDVPLTATACYP
jgi:Flp pilus assembly protein TadG